MIKEIIQQWDANKDELEEYFRSHKQIDYDNYKAIVKAVFIYAIKSIPGEYGNEYKFQTDRITVVDDGDYQGTQIFLIPKATYQPEASDYLVTDTYYGSCSGCDTLEGISRYSDGFPTPEQVSEYMTLALHLIQKLRWLPE